MKHQEFKVVDNLLYSVGTEKNLVIPKNVIGFHKNMLWNPTNDIETITVEKGNKVYKAKNNCLIEKKTNNVVLMCKNSILPDVTKIVERIDKMVDKATIYNPVIKADLLPSIGVSAFHARTHGKRRAFKIIIPEGYGKIERMAFFGQKIDEVRLPQSLTTIGREAFAFTDIEKIYIPPNVKEIGYGVFRGCNKLKEIKVDKNNRYFYSENNCLIRKADKTLIAALDNPIVPEGVKNIGILSLESLEHTRIITLPKSLEQIYATKVKNIKDIILQFPFFMVPSKEKGGISKLYRPLYKVPENSVGYKFCKKFGLPMSIVGA